MNNNNIQAFMSTLITTCANCGKEEDGDTTHKKCSACLSLKYCSRDCQISHRPIHKKACKRRVAELFDEKLFADPPPPEECPICMIPVPQENQSQFMECCGKFVCHGCIYALLESGGKDICAFCRTPPASSDEELTKRLHKIMDKGNVDAFNCLGIAYSNGSMGLPQNWAKANELWLKAGQLGCAGAYFNLGMHYRDGKGVEVDKKREKKFYELAAMGGDINARLSLGWMERQAENYVRAFKHYILAAKAGDKGSLDTVKGVYAEGLITKDEYTNTLRAYQKRQDEIMVDSRVKAAASGIFVNDRTTEGE